MRKSPLTSGERLQRQGQAEAGAVANLIVIGASAGGHRALMEIVKDLSDDMPAAIVILLHMPVGSDANVKWSVGRFSRLPMIEVENEEPLRHGCIYIPQPGRSAIVTDGMMTVEDQVSHRPITTINRLFESAAKSFGERVIGVVLSGLLRDGTEGLRAVHEAGGVTMVQDPEEAEYGDMPRNAMENLPVTFCLNLAEIGPALELLVRRTARFETGLQVAVRTLRERAALLVRLARQSHGNAGTLGFLEDELAAVKDDIRSIDNLLQGSPPHET